MSDTIWVRRKSQAGTANSGDDVDHSLFCKNAQELDKLAQSIGVGKLSCPLGRAPSGCRFAASVA